MEKVLEQVEKYILYILVFLFPIVVISVSSNPFVIPKLELLVFSISLLIFLRALKIIITGKLDFSVGNFDLPIFIIALSFILSTILRTPNKMEAFLLPGTTTAVISGVLLYFIINQQKDEEKRNLSLVLFLSATAFSALTLLAFSGLFEKIPQLPAYIRAKGFTPDGGYIPSAIFLLTMFPLGLGLVFAIKEKTRKILIMVASIVVILGLVLSIYNIIPGRPTSPRFPSYNVSWNIAIDSLKNSPVLGIGPGNYLTAFNRFRPLSYNQTDLWAVKFTTATSFYLTFLTEVGMLGTAGLILLLFNLYKTAKADLREKRLVQWGFGSIANLVSLTIIVIVLALLPATTLLIVLFFILFSLNAKVHKTTLSLMTQGQVEGATAQAVTSRFPAFLISVPVIIVLFLFGIRAVKIAAGEYKFIKALNALATNDAAKTYDTLREAIRLNPLVDRYHATFVRVDLALANAIARKAAGPEPVEGAAPTQSQITDQDRQNITLLVQQAIAEAKATVALNPLRSGNWEVLAQTYQTIMPLAQGADNFAIQTYRQAIALDPINPNLRIALGGIHYIKKDYENAVKVFELATSAKSNHANAHYNLSFALRDKGDLNGAIQEMTLVLSLIPDKTSQDYQVAKKALEDMQAKKKEEAQTGQELTPPQGQEAPQLEPPVELSEGSEPPEAPASTQEGEPTTSPSPTGAVSPTLTP